MGTSVFDQAWGEDPKPAHSKTAPKKGDALDAIWDAPAAHDTPGNIDLRQPSDTTRTGKPVSRPAAASGDQDDGGVLGTIQHLAEGVVSGLPGGQRAVAGLSGLASLVMGHGLDVAANDVNSSLDSQRRNVAKLPTLGRLGLQMVGGAPAAALAAPLGVFGGGAAFGAATGADKDVSGDEFSKEGALERIKNMAVGGAIGGATAKGTQLVGKGIANVSNRLGVTDWAGNLVNKVSPKLAATMGTRGQVNDALARRQNILEAAAADGPSAAQQQLDHAAATQAESKRLYGLAEADNAPLNNPRLRALLADPRVAKSYQSIANTLEQSSRPLPSVSTNTVLTPRSGGNGLLSEDDIGSASAIFDKLYGTRGAKAPSIPDPRALSMLKRELYSVAQGKLESPLALKQEEAQQLLPIVDEIRNTLHTESPAWKAADQFFAGAKGEEQGFTKGFNAFQKGTAPSGEQLTESSPEALQQWVETPRYKTEPAEAMASRGDAFRAGIRGNLAQDVANAPVTKGLSKVLSAPSLAPTQTGQQIRSLMFDSPEQASALEQILAKARGTPLSQSEGVPVKGALAKIMKLAGEPDLVATPKGQALLAERLANPDLLAEGVTANKPSYQPIQHDFFAKSSLGDLMNRLPRIGMTPYRRGDLAALMLSSDLGGWASR